MKKLLQPIRTDSLKDVFVQRFEQLILSGHFHIGEKLPSERELALKLGVSRPVVHEGLVDLSVKGLVTLKPRVGAFVNDYRQQGSLALLNSLVSYHDGDLGPDLLLSLLDTRRLFEVENARLAARCRTEGQLQAFRRIIAKERTIAKPNPDALAELDFEFHHLLAMATGNMVYPLLLNSFRQVYTNLTCRFFGDPEVAETVFSFHRDMVAAIEAGNERAAAEIMRQTLDHGEKHLKTFVHLQGG